MCVGGGLIPFCFLILKRSAFSSDTPSTRLPCFTYDISQVYVVFVSTSFVAHCLLYTYCNRSFLLFLPPFKKKRLVPYDIHTGSKCC